MMVLGIDLDNTLICYEGVFQRLAVESGRLAPGVPASQKSIRRDARQAPEGDIAWQKLQGAAYGPRIQEAEPAEGVLAFLGRCAREGIPVRIISHKTEFAAQDPTRTNLRQAALAWLRAKGVLCPELSLGAESCLFANSRQEKLAHIIAQGCTHFIDDLEETFRDPDFPPGVQGILYAPAEPAPLDLPGVWAGGSWAEIQRMIFQGARGA
jgi:hypothetical protein